MVATIPVWLGNVYFWLYAGQQHIVLVCKESYLILSAAFEKNVAVE